MSEPTGEQYSLSTGERIYQFDESAWFFGTMEQCDNCFGLSADVNENDVLSFAKEQKAVVFIYEGGKLINTIL